MDSANVIAQATAGIVEPLADEMEVSIRRCYEILGKDNPIPKAKRLIRKIAHLNQNGARLIKADFDSMFAEILKPATGTLTAADLHKEAFEAIQAILHNKSKADRARELRELITVAQSMLEGCEDEGKLKAV